VRWQGDRFEWCFRFIRRVQRIVTEAKAEVAEVKPARILVVERQENVRVLLNDAFRTGRPQRSRSDSLAQSLKSLDAKKFDLMVCDLGLPE